MVLDGICSPHLRPTRWSDQTIGPTLTEPIGRVSACDDLYLYFYLYLLGDCWWSVTLGLLTNNPKGPCLMVLEAGWDLQPSLLPHLTPDPGVRPN
jgi:hypothetical protein